MVRAAVIQAGSCLFDTPATLDRLARLAGEAKAQGAELAVFPEAFVGGYPKGMDFGARIGWRTPAGRDWFARYSDGAITIPGAETARIGAIAAEHGLHLVVGAIERLGRTLYCSVLFFDPDGALAGLHRKTVPTAMERLLWGQGDGSTLPVIGTAIGRLGAAICWENYMPLLRADLYHQGVELYCAPTVDDRESWPGTMRHIALEGRCFVLSAAQYLTRGDLPSDYPEEAIAGDVLIRGGSMIVSPLGEILAAPVYDQEAVLVADLDLRDIARGKYDLDVAGHYARPDIFELRIDLQARI